MAKDTTQCKKTNDKLRGEKILKQRQKVTISPSQTASKIQKQKKLLYGKSS